MPFYTDKLHLKLIQPQDYFADESFNNVINDMDDKLVGVAHLSSGAHWQVWEKDTAYVVNDVVRWPSLHGHQYARCRQAGTSSTVTPVNNVTGSIVNDNTVKWEIMSLSDNSGDGGTILVWLSGAYYNRGDAVFYGKSLYRCRVTHQATTFANDKDNWHEIYASIRPWVTGIFYSVGDSVIINHEIYECITEHVAGASFNSAEKVNWELVGSFGLVSEWDVETNYHVGQVVTYEGLTFICITEHESNNGAFENDIVKWKLFTAGITPWGLSDYYPLGAVVVYDSKIWRCIYAHNRTTAVFEDTQQYWTPMGYNLPAYLKAWQPNTYYYLHQTVLIENKYLYKCTTSHTSATSWNLDETNWIRLGSIEGVVRDWESGVRYYPNQLVTYLGTLYRAVAIHDSGASFEQDIAEWRRINANIGYWESNKYYPQYHLVEYNNMIYRCSIAHTSTGLFDVTKWDAFLAFPVIEEWSADTTYSENRVITSSGMLLRAIDTHTSDATTILNDLTTTVNGVHWNLLYANIAPWASSTTYKIGAQVIYNNCMYKANITHTSGNTFEYDKWDLVGQFDAFIYNWQAGKYYRQYQVVLVDEELYRCNTTHTSLATWASDNGDWTKISARVIVDNWQASTVYLDNQFVMYQGILYQANQKHTSGANFEITKWTPVYANIAPWDYNVQYHVNQIVIYNNQLYKCITAHNSAYDDFEINGNKWTPVANNIAGLPVWASGVYYYPNQVVKYNGKIWRCLIAHESGNEEKPDYVKIFSVPNQFMSLNGDSTVPRQYVADMGSIRRISNIDITYAGGFLWVHTLVQISKDGTNYSTVEETSLSNSGTLHVDFYGECRYVKILVTSVTPMGSGTGGALDFEHMEVYGDSNKWEIILDPSIKLTYWAQNTRYKEGELVLYNDEFYRCTETHESTSTFDSTKWKKIPRIVIPDWKANESYVVNQVVFYDGKMYKCTTVHTSSSTFTQANWTPINDTIDDWATSKNYYTNQVVRYNNSLWRCKTQHLSATEKPEDNEIYTASGNTVDVNDTTTLPYNEVIDLGAVYKIQKLDYTEVATDMTMKYYIEMSINGTTYTDYEDNSDARYIRITVYEIDVATGAVSPQAYLDTFKVYAYSDMWEEVATMNTLIDSDIDEMFM